MSTEDYVVRWENTLPARSPAEAAREAWEMIRDPSSTASFFVVDDGHREMEIDVLVPSDGDAYRDGTVGSGGLDSPRCGADEG